MYVVDDHLDNEGRAFVTIRDARGWRQITAALAVHVLDDHDRGLYCIIDPPRWTRWVGLGPRVSVGSALLRFGQWAFVEVDCAREVWTREVDPSEIRAAFEWTASDDED